MIYELKGNYKQNNEIYLLIGGDLIHITNYSCQADIEDLVSEKFLTERDTIWYFNTLEQYRKFLKNQGYRRLSGKRKQGLHELILKHFGVR